MKKTAIAISLSLALVAFALRAQDPSPTATPQPPPSQDGGPGKPGGPHPGGGFHLLPRFAMEKLNLTDDQLKQIHELEKETLAKLQQILTADQIKTLQSLRPPPPQGQGGAPSNSAKGQ